MGTTVNNTTWYMNRFPKGLVGGGSLSVDGTNGVDGGGTRGGKAFKTLGAAKAAAVSGDTITVWPGTYHENDLLKDGVNWFFMPGAVVDYTPPQYAKATMNVAGAADNDLVFTSSVRGSASNGIVVRLLDDGSQVADTAAVVWTAATRVLTIKVKNGTTKVNTVAAAVNAQTSWTIICGYGLGASDLGLMSDVGASVTLAGGTGAVSATMDYGIFDDRDGAVACTVGGEGVFIARDLLTNTDLISAATSGMVNIESASTFRLRAAALKTQQYLSQLANALRFAHASATCYVDVDEVTDLNAGLSTLDEGAAGGGAAGSLVATGVGIQWQTGETYVRFGRIVQGAYGLWAGGSTVNTATGNLWVEGDFMQGNPGPGLYYSEGTTLNWRTWIRIKQIDTLASVGNNALCSGKHYLRCDKISGPNIGLSINHYTGKPEPIFWVESQKVTGGGASPIFRVLNGTVYASILEFEDVDGAAASAVRVGGGTLHLTSLYAALGNGKGIEHQGGTANIRGLRVDTSATDAVGNVPVSVSAAGLRLQNCVLVAPASADSVKGDAARTITNYGSVANKAKNANITVNVSALVVDVNVV